MGKTIHRPSTRALQCSILRTLAYFDVFGHPLTVAEISRFRDGGPVATSSLLVALHDLQERGLVEMERDQWGLRDTAVNRDKRNHDERRAAARMPKALRMSRLIARFPFVRAVFISGSMSKGRLAADGDIDFFIITEPGRLWACRTLLVLFKKIFLLNSRRDFCINYFLDTEHMTVEDRNHFTATEVVTLLPLYGNGNTEAFFASNEWAFKTYPHSRPPKSLEVAIGDTGLKRFGEKVLGGRLGEALDAWSMSLTWRYWRWKFDDLDPSAFDLALRTRTYVSKHHPRNFQARVLGGYAQRIAMLERVIGGPLS